MTVAPSALRRIRHDPHHRQKIVFVVIAFVYEFLCEFVFNSFKWFRYALDQVSPSRSIIEQNSAYNKKTYYQAQA